MRETRIFPRSSTSPPCSICGEEKRGSGALVRISLLHYHSPPRRSTEQLRGTGQDQMGSRTTITCSLLPSSRGTLPSPIRRVLGRGDLMEDPPCDIGAYVMPEIGCSNSAAGEMLAGCKGCVRPQGGAPLKEMEGCGGGSRFLLFLPSCRNGVTPVSPRKARLASLRPNYVLLRLRTRPFLARSRWFLPASSGGSRGAASPGRQLQVADLIPFFMYYLRETLPSSPNPLPI